MKITKLPIIIMCISVIVILVWMFLIVPDLKNNPEYFETYLQGIGVTTDDTQIGGGQGELIPFEVYVRQEITEQEGDVLKVRTSFVGRDFGTKEIFWSWEYIDLVDRTTRKILDREDDVYFIFPHNVQKQDYLFLSYSNHVPLEPKFVRTDVLHDVDVYMFVSNQTFDTTELWPEFESEQVVENSIITYWIEPITGKILAFESKGESWLIIDDKKNLLMTLDIKTVEFSDIKETKTVLDQIQIFYMYDVIIPILLVAISSGAIMVVFINQNLKMRTIELRQTKKQRVEEILYEVIPDCVVTFDKNNRVKDCNIKFVDALGFSKDELIGKNRADLIIPEEQESDLDIVQRISEGQQVMEFNLNLKKKDGSVFHSIWNAIPMYDDNDKYIGFFSTGFDLTEMDKIKDEFIAIISHDLKSPLTPIVGWCDALQDPDILGIITPKQSNAVQIISKNAEKLQRLINDLLDVQKLGLSRMTFEKYDFQVDGMMEDITKSFENVLKEKQIELFYTSKNGKISLKSDRRKIEQVLTNLIYNAIDFVPEKIGKIEINIKNENNGMMLFGVKDNGKGISKEKQKNLFQRFYQADTSARRKYGGTGLGLSICKGIVEGLGGKIWVESQEGIGSNFYFIIPRW